MKKPVPGSRVRSIALIGMRGSGKSTVAKAIAERLAGSSLDTDDLVERLTGKTIAHIFAEEGEPAFRRYETQAVARAVAAAPTVISVGGGAVLDERNVEALRGVATVVWLTAPAEVLWQRISSDPTTPARRPGLTTASGVAELKELLAAREPIYQRIADLIVETSGKDAEAVTQEIVDRVSRFAL